MSLSDQNQALVESVTGVMLNPSASLEREFALTLGELYRLLDAARQEGAGDWRPTHRHVKRGTVYRLVADAVLQTEVPVSDGAYLALYQGDDGKFWVRPADEFKDGRFEALPADRPPSSQESAFPAEAGLGRSHD